MQAELLEIDSENTDSLLNALSIYKQLIHAKQEDRQSVKCYLSIYKVLYSFENMKSYVYMDDHVWHELSEMYIITNNLNKSVYCFEKVLLH
jgi:hypothetical protein